MDLVTVGAFPTAAQAELAKNLLESEGIPAFVEEDATGDLFHLSAPFGEAKVSVAGEHAEQARALLDAAERHELAGDSAHDAEEHADDPPADAE
jgi:Putative prokaryotic signal transducing protein